MCLLLLLLWAAAGCSQDFSAFRFKRETSRHPARNPPADAGPAAPSSAADGGAPADAKVWNPLEPGPSVSALDAAATRTRDAKVTPRDGSVDASGPSGAADGAAADAQADAGLSTEPTDATLPAAEPVDATVDEPADADTPSLDAEAPPDEPAARRAPSQAPMAAGAAGANAVDAAQQSGTPSVEPSGERSPGVQPDAAAADASVHDGAALRLQLCEAGWDELDAGPARCRACACDACATPILDCLLRGTAAERALCNDVLLCALRNRCQDYTCYCSTSGCNYPEPVGNGPCAAIINAAAGGTRSQVSALRYENPVDFDEPLIRASKAIACVRGVHPSSPGPTVSGMCTAACD